MGLPMPWVSIHGTGTDSAGRKQYLYHSRWRERRDQQKFDEMLDFARMLPKIRRTVERDLASDEPTREHVLAAAVRLLDRGFFRSAAKITPRTTTATGSRRCESGT